MIQLYFAVGAVFLIYLVTHLLRKKRKTNRIISIDDKKCARCNSCITHCPNGVLKMEPEEGKDMHVTVKNPNLCTECEHCIKSCNFGAIRLIDKIQLSSTQEKIQFNNKH
ncbi:4Fe-4S dicluster domain-containing protein [Segatella paludivivens]|uniref:4Fe-4S dicluster domain-containing protein n=1 Tax=Segatella paludivivens TaxID=185294 RepID=UPI0003790C71